ncbi:MAG: hypothetical protein BroJett025_01650 [Patescibacteria group bacterium]|nr:MAG: hypothetical protein BroJett025_01650 [Patescibacteria group bacterium]
MIKKHIPEHNDEFHQRAIETFENEGGPPIETDTKKQIVQEKKRKKKRAGRGKTEK